MQETILYHIPGGEADQAFVASVTHASVLKSALSRVSNGLLSGW